MSESVARARSTDPLTSHLAAAQVTGEQQSNWINVIWHLVTDTPNRNMRWYCNEYIRVHGGDAGLYGTICTNFSKAESQGYIRVSGTETSEYTQRLVHTYEAVTESQSKKIESQLLQEKGARKSARHAAKREADRIKALRLEHGNDSGEYGV